MAMGSQLFGNATSLGMVDCIAGNTGMADAPRLAVALGWFAVVAAIVCIQVARLAAGADAGNHS